jgi:hypothetical protein
MKSLTSLLLILAFSVALAESPNPSPSPSSWPTPSPTPTSPPPPNYTLSVSKTGVGTVTSNDGRINCGTLSCSKTYYYGASVSLYATPAAGYCFSHWSGACSGKSCSVQLYQSKSVVANFFLNPSLTVTKTGTGKGSVAAALPPGGINCPTTCNSQTVSYPDGTTVPLGAGTDATSWFYGWGGSCGGNGACNVTLTCGSNKSVSAQFNTNNVCAHPAPYISSTPSSICLTPTTPGSFKVFTQGSADVVTTGYSQDSRLAIACSPPLGTRGPQTFNCSVSVKALTSGAATPPMDTGLSFTAAASGCQSATTSVIANLRDCCAGGKEGEIGKNDCKKEACLCPGGLVPLNGKCPCDGGNPPACNVSGVCDPNSNAFNQACWLPMNGYQYCTGQHGALSACREQGKWVLYLSFTLEEDVPESDKSKLEAIVACAKEQLSDLIGPIEIIYDYDARVKPGYNPISVTNENCRSNAGRWCLGEGKNNSCASPYCETAVHEILHLLGLPDDYGDRKNPCGPAWTPPNCASGEYSPLDNIMATGVMRGCPTKLPASRRSMPFWLLCPSPCPGTTCSLNGTCGPSCSACAGVKQTCAQRLGTSCGDCHPFPR